MATCSEPLVWTCKACGHSFHEKEWVKAGRKCPACERTAGNWKCSLCQEAFNQPALSTKHPCRRGSTNDPPVRSQLLQRRFSWLLVLVALLTLALGVCLISLWQAHRRQPKPEFITTPPVPILQKRTIPEAQEPLVARGKTFQIIRPELDIEVDRALRNFDLTRSAVPSDKMQSLEYNILNQMVNRRVALNEARGLTFTNLTSQAKDQLEKIKKKYSTDEAFQNQLTQAHTTEVDMLQEIEQKIMVDTLMRARVEPLLKTPTEEEVLRFYNENPKLWQPKTGTRTLRLDEVRDEVIAHLRRLQQGEKTREYLEELRRKEGVIIMIPKPPPDSQAP